MPKEEKPKQPKQHYDVIRPKTKKSTPARQLDVVAPVAEPAAAKAANTSLLGMFKKLFASVVFGRLYAIVALIILGATTLVWATLGAQLHMANADQLADPFLFQSSSTFHGALFPGAHSFLLKWPLFWLIRLGHFSTAAFVGVTVGIVVLTVASLVIVMYRIERRPAVFATLCLALASVLLLVPNAPYPGALLPMNLAMLATRNIEYAVYLLSLVLLIRSPKARSWRFWVGFVCLLVLMASDKLFLVMSVGAGGIGLLLYSLRQVRKHSDFMAHWLLASLLAAAGSAVLIAIINGLGITTIVNTSSASPYALSLGGHNLILGSLYAVLGFFTNFGANPAFAATVLRDIPKQAANHLLTPAGFGYLVNLAICLTGIVVAVKVVIRSVRKPQKKQPSPDAATTLSLALLLSTLIAVVVFVLTNHYYAVDGRYLTIAVFALFVSCADYARLHVWRRNYVVIAGLVILVGIFMGIPTTINNYADSQQALSDIANRNTQVAQVLKQRHVTTLVGDYWRVLPIQQATHRSLQILPLQTCSQPRDSLVTTTGRPNLTNHSFAYLLSLDKSLTDFPNCSAAQISVAYGHPDASILLAGTFANPKEELLFYDHGAHPIPTPNNQGQQTLTSLQPISPDKLPSPTCEGPTVMNIVAHQDDDLLFTSPDLLADIHAGHCVRSVYVTAGDAGFSQYYWLSRQEGSEAAYANMLGHSSVWMQRTIKLGTREYATVASPRGNSHISLVFLNLPDGNITGNGFGASHYESIAKLEAGKIKFINSVDAQSSYSSAQLTAALLKLMQTFQPTEIRTQATTNLSEEYPDHSDHLATARFARQAYEQYLSSLTADTVAPSIHYYVGYPIHAQPPNVGEPELTQKEAAFLAYAKYDGGVCHSVEECSQTPTYEAYLSRQYEQPAE